MKKRIVIVSIIVSLLVLLGVYLNYENNTLQISYYEIESEKIPVEFDNYKIIQISDFHNTDSAKLQESLVHAITEEKPNIIVITGDFVDSRRTNIDVSIKFIEKIDDIAPIYYINGNHEAGIDSYDNLKQRLLELGVYVLENTSTTLEINNSYIDLIGVSDPTFSETYEYMQDSDIISNEIRRIVSENDNYKILLSHRPELFETYVTEGMDLVFTGHAHGGQIRIPFIGALIAPHQGIFPKYTSGIITSKDTNMIISRGIGNSLFPFRINNRPELVITVLKSTIWTSIL